MKLDLNDGKAFIIDKGVKGNFFNKYNSRIWRKINVYVDFFFFTFAFLVVKCFVYYKQYILLGHFFILISRNTITVKGQHRNWIFGFRLIWVIFEFQGNAIALGYKYWTPIKVVTWDSRQRRTSKRKRTDCFISNYVDDFY